MHTFAGINLSFGFMGPLMRRSGVIFIRRKLDDPLYKYVLRQFISYIVEKRFNLSWSIEGTRSRTGKMLPPKLGLMSYVADAYLEGRSDDILLQPVSISFDQLHETAEYAAYARGGEKTPEGLSWLYNFIKAQGERNYGKIYVRFPEAVSMREYLGEPGGPIAKDEAAKRLAMKKMAIEVSWRILRATPVNATGLVSALLLTTRGTALTLDQLHHTLQDSLDYLERKQAPMTNSALRLRTADGVRAALDALSNGHPVTCVDGGREPVWRIAPEQEHEAAFYRNTIIDAFLETAIVEMALAYAARAEGDRLEAFWNQAMRLRDLLKFDFYFADSAAFREHLTEELSWNDDWESHVAAGGDEIDAILRAKRPLIAQAVLRPYIEAYEIVADVLRDAPAEIDEKELTKKALGVGNQYVAQNRVRSTEAASALLFATARQVAADQHLLEPAADLAERRTAFRDELRDVLRDMDPGSSRSRVNSSTSERWSAAGYVTSPRSGPCPPRAGASATSPSRRSSRAKTGFRSSFSAKCCCPSRRAQRSRRCSGWRRITSETGSSVSASTRSWWKRRIANSSSKPPSATPNPARGLTSTCSTPHTSTTSGTSGSPTTSTVWSAPIYMSTMLAGIPISWMATGCRLSPTPLLLRRTGYRHWKRYADNNDSVNPCSTLPSCSRTPCGRS